MAQLTGFTLCESQINISTKQGNKVQAQGITSLFKLKYCPGLFSFSLIISLYDDDFSGSHSFIIKVNTPEGNEIASLPGAFADPKSPDGQPAHGLTIGMDLRNLEILVLGNYQVEVIYDDKSIGKYPLILEG